MHSHPGSFEFEGTARFQIVRRLGGGGMGVVYEAIDRDRNMPVALKTLRTLDGGAVLRFKNEFRWLQDLQHPNLVSLGELFSEDGIWFFTMELVEGVDLLRWVRPDDPGLHDEPMDRAASPDEQTDERRFGQARPAGFDEARLRAALGQLARGLHALHAANKVHRDIKPSNILVTPSGRVVLLDFGLAKQLSPTGHQSDTHVVGTVDYMAPEQAASRPVGPEADWYSVGVILFQALTGKLPFVGPPLQILISKQSQRPPAPSTFNPQVPPDLEALCVELLHADPRARPDGAELLRRLGVDEARPAACTTRTGAAPFVGRAGELRVLREAYEDSRRGAPVVVYVQGESGVGKSAMVRRFTDELAEGTVVLSGRCYERESVPYKAFDGIVDALSRYMTRLPRDQAAALLPVRASLLAQVFPVLRRVEAVAQAPLIRADTISPQELRQRVFASLRELLRRIADRHPLVLVVDDLQWADADSLALLGEVMRPPEAPALLLVATIRVASDSSSSNSGLVLQLANAVQGDVRHVELKRLAPDEARELTALLLGDRGAEHAAAIAEEAGGHPLFIDELVRHALGGQAPASLRLDDALWARVSRLDAPARQLLELIAVAGGPLMQETGARAAAFDFAEFGKHVSLLRVANLVRTTGARRTDLIEPYHDRVREAVLQHLDARAKKRCHERLALALEAAGRTDAEGLMVHWRGAGDTERAAHYAAIAAAQAADALAFDRAARLYRLAIELRPIEGAAFQARLGAVLADAGRSGEAALAYLEAAKGASPQESLDLQRRAAEQLLFSGRIDAGMAAITRILEELDLELPKSPQWALASLALKRARLRLRGYGFRRRQASQVSPAELAKIDLCWSVGVGLGLVDDVRSADFQVQHMLLALEAGEPFRVLRGLATEVVYAASRGARARTARLLDATRELAEQLKQPHGLALASMSAGLAAYLDGRWREARAQLDETEATLRERCAGVAWELDTTHIMSLFATLALGHLAELQARVPAILRGAIERGDLYASTSIRTGMNVLWLLRDDPERAEMDVGEAMRKWSQKGFHIQHEYELFARTQTAIYAGRAAEGLALMRTRWPALEASLLLKVQLVRAQALELRARACLAAAVTDAAERPALLAEVEAVARRLAHERRPWVDGHVHALRAGAAALRGDGARAAALLDEAARAFDAADMALHACVARLRRGTLIGGDVGRELVDTASAWMSAEGVKAPARFADLVLPGFIR